MFNIQLPLFLNLGFGLVDGLELFGVNAIGSYNYFFFFYYGVEVVILANTSSLLVVVILLCGRQKRLLSSQQMAGQTEK